jgi:hypothetical protein
MDQDGAVGLDQQEPGGEGEMGFEPANVINGATGYDESHAVQTTVSAAFPAVAVQGTGPWPAVAPVRQGRAGDVPAKAEWRHAPLQPSPPPQSVRARCGRAGRRKKRRSGDVPELDLERARAGIARRESAPDGEWMVRTMTAKNAEKTYICPGCSTAVLPGSPTWWCGRTTTCSERPPGWPSGATGTPTAGRPATYRYR